MSKIIPISIFLVCLFIISFYIITAPSITHQEVISIFENNKNHFEIIKDYMLTQEKSKFIRKSHLDEIKDIQVYTSLKYLFDKTNCSYIENTTMHDIKEERTVSVTFVFFISSREQIEIAFIDEYPKELEGGAYINHIADKWYLITVFRV